MFLNILSANLIIYKIILIIVRIKTYYQIIGDDISVVPIVLISQVGYKLFI